MKRAYIAFGIAMMAYASSSAACACFVERMLGKWQCVGPTCIPDHATSELYKTIDNIFKWRDGVGNEAVVTVDNLYLILAWSWGQKNAYWINPKCDEIALGANHSWRKL